MKSFEKFHFLMQLTHTANSTLGKYLNFDASYISRIRSGKRGFPKNQPFTDPASGYFAEHITDSFQKKMAGEMICPGRDWPENQHTAKKMIAEWLSVPDHADSSPVSGILEGLSSVNSDVLPSLGMMTEAASAQKEPEVQFFYGNEGKREAVLHFLTSLVGLKEMPPLLLYSNEEFNWMYEDPVFSKKWAMLLITYMKKGGRIKIAHTISRASGEMLVALQKWIPLYMTGAIEPYYYPKILDRVFRKTLFIAEGHSAIAASSVGERTEQACNFLIRNPEAVRSLEKEYWNFFELCRPLMQIFKMTERRQFSEVLQKFHSTTGSMITVRSAPSFYTMPLSAAKSISRRTGSSWILKQQEAGEAVFARMAEEEVPFTEILNLPKEEDILAGRIPVSMCDLLGTPGLCYTPAEFAEHLRSVAEKLRTVASYHVVLSSAIPQNEMIDVKEDVGVILVKSDPPGIAFAMDEARMTAAFWDYLGEIPDRIPAKQKKETLRILTAMAARLAEK